MDTWSDLCRCCMTANSNVSLLDPEQNLKEKFLEVTNIEVKLEDKLPNKLCDGCYNEMITAYQFRNKCIDTDNKLKQQLKEFTTTKEEELQHHKMDDGEELDETEKASSEKLYESENNMYETEKLDYNMMDQSTDSKNESSKTQEPDDIMKQLADIVKKNALDSDDDCCYVLVIGNPKEKPAPKSEPEYEDDKYTERIIKYHDSDNYSDDDHRYLSDYSYQSDEISDFEDSDKKTVGDHICKLCGKDFEYAEILLGHSLLHSSTGLLINCPFCQQPIKRNALTTHIQTGHVSERPCCSICFKTYSTKKNLKRHMVVHKEIQLKEFECDLCFKSFHEKYTMQMHRLTHTHPYYCSQCDRNFLNRTMLNEHICSKTDKRGDEFMAVKQANIRGRPKKFPNAKPQQRNPRPKENPQCYQCGEVLSNRRELQTHMQTTHDNVNSDKMKRFECSICRKRFTSGAKLTMHERVHTNERPYPCDVCSHRFKTKTHLRTHQLTHMKEKKFSCPLCTRQFNHKYNLRHHLKSHVGDKSSISRKRLKSSQHLNKLSP